jgi:hypothetical protein
MRKRERERIIGGEREKEGEQRKFLNRLSESVFTNLEELNRSRPSAYAMYLLNCVRNILPIYILSD